MRDPSLEMKLCDEFCPSDGQRCRFYGIPEVGRASVPGRRVRILLKLQYQVCYQQLRHLRRKDEG